jgi:hypothetical protein
VNERRSGRFSGYRVNCEYVPCLPARVVADCLADPRQIPYLLIWARHSVRAERASNRGYPSVEPREAMRLAPNSFFAEAAPCVQVERWNGTRMSLWVTERPLPCYSGKTLLLVCNRCLRPRRALYGREAVKHARYIKHADWLCRGCASLSYASEGGALIYRTRCGVTRRLSGLHLWPRPEPWEPLVFTSPVQALDWGLVQNVNLIGAQSKV